MVCGSYENCGTFFSLPLSLSFLYSHTHTHKLSFSKLPLWRGHTLFFFTDINSLSIFFSLAFFAPSSFLPQSTHTPHKTFSLPFLDSQFPGKEEECTTDGLSVRPYNLTALLRLHFIGDNTHTRTHARAHTYKHNTHTHTRTHILCDSYPSIPPTHTTYFILSSLSLSALVTKQKI